MTKVQVICNYVFTAALYKTVIYVKEKSYKRLVICTASQGVIRGIEGVNVVTTRRKPGAVFGRNPNSPQTRFKSKIYSPDLFSVDLIPHRQTNFSFLSLSFSKSCFFVPILLHILENLTATFQANLQSQGLVVGKFLFL